MTPPGTSQRLQPGTAAPAAPAVQPRPRRRWIWALVALVTVAVVVPVTGRYVLMARADRQFDPPVTYRHPISDLQVEASGGSLITIRAGRPGEVTVRSQLSWLLEEPAVSQSWQGTAFQVGATCPKVDPFGYCQISVTISVPPGTALQGQAGAGSMTVVGLTGPLHLTATSGLLVARNVSGPVWAAAGSGTLVARDGLRSPTVHASVASGLISLVFGTAPHRATVSVGTGAADITVPAGSRYRVRGSAGSGNLSLSPGLSDPESDLLLVATVGTGEARIGYPPGSH